MYNVYDKMYRTGVLSLPFAMTQLPSQSTVLRPMFTCEVKTTDSDIYYKLKVRIRTDGSRMIIGLDYDDLYAPVIDGDIMLPMIAVGISLGMMFYSLIFLMCFRAISYMIQTNDITCKS